MAEALSAYWKALGKTWAKLLAVFLPANIFLVWIRAQTAMRFDAGDGIPAIALRPERHVSLLINLTLGVLALVIIARAAWQTIAKPSDEADVSRSLVASIGRTFGTVMLLCFLVGAYLFVALVGIYFLLPKIVGLFGLSVSSAVGIMQMLFLVVALAGLFAILTRWMLAVTLSALFRMSGFRATDMSVALLRGRMWKSLFYAVGAGLVAAAFRAVPQVVYYCDVIGFAHPFTESAACGKLAWAALMVLSGVLMNLASLFVVVAFVVYIRRIKEPAEDALASPRRAVMCLVAAGALLAVGLTEVLGVRASRSGRDFGDVLSRRRIIWAEIPFCSHCGWAYDYSSDCKSHEFDVFVRKHFVGGVGKSGVEYPAYSVKLSPRDSTRAPTPKEHELVVESARKTPSRDKTPISPMSAVGLNWLQSYSVCGRGIPRRRKK
ncbi:MAG: hypothetical protein IJG18_11860 [Kiritimatiellae bacterium]|nr:hypothetical protein [Kiritimatiellia bacterium]